MSEHDDNEAPAARPTLSVVVPVYNSADTLPELVARIGQLDVEGGFELVMVNDGSRDASAEVGARLAREARFPVTFVNLSRNFGEHNAVMAAYHHARGRYIVNIDDDFQNPPEEIVKLLRHAQEGDFDVVYTTYERKGPRWRGLGSWLTNKMADVFLDKPKGLYLSSFRCINAFVKDQICRYEGAFPYVDGMILQVTQRIGVVEVGHDERKAGQSGYTLRKLLLLWSSTFVNFSIAPLRLSTGLGIAMASMGFLGTLWVVIEHFVLENPAGWGSTMCALLVFNGTQLIILGIAGEYLGRLYLNANKRPQFVVRECVEGGRGEASAAGGATP